MIDSGVQLLVIAPLNSDGWDSVFAKASAKKVPIVTIDRKINATSCTDYLTFIGSDFEEQGKRAADKMAASLGNKGSVAILLGAPGNNVTTLRTKGFKDQIAKVAPDIKIDLRADRTVLPRGGPEGLRAVAAVQARTSTASTRRTTRWRSAPSSP